MAARSIDSMKIGGGIGKVVKIPGVKLHGLLLEVCRIAAAGLAVQGDGWLNTGKKTVVQLARDDGEEPPRSASYLQQMLVRLQIQLADGPIRAVFVWMAV